MTAWSWTFGDGGTSALPNPLHTYPARGPWTATLTVTDSAGTTATTSQTVLLCAPPVAAFGVILVDGCGVHDPQILLADSSTDADGPIAHWL